jgi:hypothetical protein
LNDAATRRLQRDRMAGIGPEHGSRQHLPLRDPASRWRPRRPISKPLARRHPPASRSTATDSPPSPPRRRRSPRCSRGTPNPGLKSPGYTQEALICPRPTGRHHSPRPGTSTAESYRSPARAQCDALMPVVMGRWIGAELVWLRSYIVGPASGALSRDVAGERKLVAGSGVPGAPVVRCTPTEIGPELRSPNRSSIGRPVNEQQNLLAGVEGDFARGRQCSVWADI